MVDVIAQLINSLKMANRANKVSTTVPYSNFRLSMLETLKRAGFVGSITTKGKKVIKEIEVELLYEDGKPKIQGVKQISKYSRRLYVKSTDLKPVRSGYGATIVTTPQGVMIDKEARKAKVGGEILFNIW